MKRFAVLLLALPVVGCGSGSEDFSVDVAMDTGQVQAQLMALDGGEFHSYAGLAPLRATNPEPGVLRYSFLDENGEETGTLQFRIEGLDGGRSRIHAALDLDAVPYELDGETLYVSEERGEDMLEQGLQAWAENVNASGYGSLADVDDTLSMFAIVMQPDRLDALDDPSAALAWDDGAQYDYVPDYDSYDEEPVYDSGGWAGADTGGGMGEDDWGNNK